MSDPPVNNAGAQTPVKPRAKSFECPSCGGAVTIRTPGLAMSAVCPNCRTVIDVTNDCFKILSQYYRSIQKPYIPSIELGTRGKLKGRLWEVIGFMVRADKSSGYTWEEYLLFNPYYGYRWLTQSAGHWNIVTTTKTKPKQSGSCVILNDTGYRLFYTGTVVVKWVMGEFYWRVKVDNEVTMSDFIAPPYMLSSELDNKELVWAISDYLEPKEIVKAFKVTDEALSARVGIGPNQPSGNTRAWKAMWPFWAAFLVFLTAAQICFCSTAANQVVYHNFVKFDTNTKVPEVTTPVFEINKDHGNVKIDLSANADNSWVYIDGELVNDETGATYAFDRSIEYYHGYEDGESWSEGSTSADIFLTYIPKGRYYLNLNAESGSFLPRQSTYGVAVTSDVASFGNYWWFLILISIWPVWQWVMSRRDEVKRWSESDFSPYASSSSSSTYSIDDDD